MSNRHIAIVGLGLMGSSLAKALRRTNPHFTITGTDSNPENRLLAERDASVDSVVTSFEEAVSNAQVIFLCTPVHTIAELLGKLAGIVAPGTIVTDVGSLKSDVMKASEQILPKEIHFIGGHPMAGGERSGYSAGNAHMFENAYYILTPRTDTPVTVINDLEHLVASTGALPLIMDPDVHDMQVGAVSHLPHIIAATLVNTVKEWEMPDRTVQKLAAGGFKDITRIASSNPEMWRDISLSNKKQLLPMISEFIRKLASFEEALKDHREDTVEAFYQTAREFRNEIPSSDSLYLLPYYKVYVDVKDQPGSIAEVASLLSREKVNIKNMQIIHSREDEPGCLVVSVEDLAAQDKALLVLNQVGSYAYIKD